MTEIRTIRGVTIALLTGDLDHHSARLMRSEIDHELNDKRPQRLIIDFSAVTFMDSSGIGLIMGRYKLMSERGGEVIVSRPPMYIKKVLHLAGVDKLAAITDEPFAYIPEPEETEEEEVNSVEQTAANAT